MDMSEQSFGSMQAFESPFSEDGALRTFISRHRSILPSNDARLEQYPKRDLY